MVNFVSAGVGSYWPSESTASACTVTGPPAGGTGNENDQVVDVAPGEPSVAGFGVNAGLHVLVDASHHRPFILTATSTRATAVSSEAVPVICCAAVYGFVEPLAGLEMAVDGRGLVGPPGR